jgi:peptide subunit release factor 1 (eRF1)
MKTITAECSNCESSYDIIYQEQLVSEEYPEICPFCGEQIDELTESDYIEDDDAMDNQEWDD